MKLFEYIYEDNVDSIYDAYEKVLDTNFITEEICESFESFCKFLDKKEVKTLAMGIDASDFTKEYFRRDIEEVEPSDVIKYYYIHLIHLNPLEELETIPLSYISDEPDIRGNNLYLDNFGSAKKLNIKYNENFDTFNEDTDW